MLPGRKILTTLEDLQVFIDLRNIARQNVENDFYMNANLNSQIG